MMSVADSGTGSARGPSGAIKNKAIELGFDLVGIATAESPTHAQFYLDWLDRGMHGSMAYLARPDAIARRLDPKATLSGARSIIMVAMNYHDPDNGPVDDPSLPVIARYARGTDYHFVFEEKLDQLATSIRALAGTEVQTRCYVDYGPVMERDHAQRAGLGWIGKNTMLIHPNVGSYFFLGAVLTDLPLAADEPFRADHCGTCTRCIDACPTGAIVGPRHLDSRLCISYLTIELRQPIPEHLRSLVGNRVFGCDICQEVCPWNQGAPGASEIHFRPSEDTTGLTLADLMALGDGEFRTHFSKTALMRAKRSGLQRNVAVALGNWGQPDAVPSLKRALAADESLVRGHAAWALGRIDSYEAQQALVSRLDIETDDWVKEEIERALKPR
jgi:epoxyqueuosine reductase